ncbi:MAG: hypothetical protein J6Q13_01840 [Clostridia bacterium]|nr:hypothetical protein [Clostridia bacterium]
MDYIELIKECLPYVLSIFATIVAFMKGKTKKTLSAEEKQEKLSSIKAKADKKYNCYVDKQLKKNKIENVLIETSENKETEV